MDLIYITQEVNVVYLIYVPKDKTSNNIETHQWCNGKRSRLECDRLWVRAPIGSNQSV
jgi:hypothetical protein